MLMLTLYNAVCVHSLCVSHPQTAVFDAEGENSLVLVTWPTISVAAEYFKYEENNCVLYRLDVNVMNYTPPDLSQAAGFNAETLTPKLDSNGDLMKEGEVRVISI